MRDLKYNQTTQVLLHKATSDGQLKVIGLSKDPDNNDLTSANVNWVVTINEHFLKKEAGI